MMPDQVIVESTVNLRHRVQAGQHEWIADEPASVGGEDMGPDPYDHLLAALGACTSMTLLLYARRKQWPLEQVRVALSHDKIHAEDCKNCDTKNGRVDRIEKAIFLQGDLTDEQVSRLGEIAEKCPVNQTLQGELLMKTTIDVYKEAPRL